ncbi:MAG: hypothetical protein AAB256_03225 [Deltaproteobacteria bacterium]
MNKLKPERNPSTILSVFKRVMNKKYVITLWQESGDIKVANKAYVSDISEKENAFTLVPKDPKITFNFQNH